jgi:hypothetical protein
VYKKQKPWNFFGKPWKKLRKILQNLGKTLEIFLGKIFKKTLIKPKKLPNPEKIFGKFWREH